MEHDLKPPKVSRAEVSVTGSKTEKSPTMRLWLLLGAVLSVLLVVLLVLPSMVAAPASATRVSPAEPEPPSIPEESAEGLENMQLRIEAEQALQKFLRLQAQPDLRNAEIWAIEDWSVAINTAARGDDEFGRGRFAPALLAYKHAGDQLQAILNDRERTLRKNLESGWQYLQENAVEEARLAFGNVIAMVPDHQQAQLGRERAAVRMQVLELLEAARQAEVTDDLQLAAQTYIGALQLDPLYSPAQEALEKVEFELRERAFQASLGRALGALEGGDFVVAEKALLEANKINPGSPAVKDARERLFSARRQASLDRLRRQAQQWVQKEDWSAAADKYARALTIDPKAAFARNGLARAQEKLQLHRQLDHYLTDPTRLYSDDPLENARNLLTANLQTAANEPLLAGKLAKLRDAVKLAEIPVELIIFSDNLTQVTIYKVGRLGSFEKKQLSLRPGKYTVTGSRRGYRDVLKVIELRPGVQDQSLKISTEEQI